MSTIASAKDESRRFGVSVDEFPELRDLVRSYDDKRELFQRVNINVPKEQRNNEGFTYLLKLGETGLYKIGCSKNIERRLLSLNHEREIPFTVVWSSPSPDMYSAEAKLHMTYRAKGVGAELFLLSAEDIATITAQIA